MRLVTWNVNSLRARLPRVLELLAELRPDAVCLQETKLAEGDFPERELREAGYHCVDWSAGRSAGVAMLARAGRPLEDVRRGLPGWSGEGPARWIEATLDGMRVVSVYVPNGRSRGSPAFGEKLAFLDAMVSRVSALRERPLIVAGDLNVAPADIDVYDPAAFATSTHVTPEERGRLAAMLAGGMVDAFRAMHPDEIGYTWWDYRAGHFHRRLGLRIDLVLLSAALAPRLRSCTVVRAYRKGSRPSDHAPLVVDLELPSRGRV